MNLIEIGRVGRPHGLKGEIKLHVEAHFEDDLLQASAVLIGEPPVPYFLASARGGGAFIARFEELDKREEVVLLSNQPIYLREEDVADPEPVTDDNPFSHLSGYHIQAEGYELLGPIQEIVEMPQHYLALIQRNGAAHYIPLHEDLIVEEKETEQLLVMSLPEGLAE